MKLVFEQSVCTSEETCRMCHGKLKAHVLRVEDVHWHPEPLLLARCASCGTHQFLGDNPVVGYDYDGFESDYWYNYVQSGAGITAMLEPLLATSPTKGKTLLDVGCGFGFVPHFWETTGYGSAVGLETSLYGRKGRERLGVEIYHKYYSEAVEIHGRTFDYVFSSEVIEHVPDPEAFIREISAGLSNGGILVLTTPSASAVRQDALEYNTIAVLSPGFHFFISSRLALERLLKRCGFDHVVVKDIDGRLFAWASHHELPPLRNGFDHWDSYFDYLDHLAGLSDPHVAGGALYRLMKDAVNTGAIHRAVSAADRLKELASSVYGISLLDPEASVERFLQLERISNAEFPSWFGCALLFFAKTLQAADCDRHVFGPLIDASIRVMVKEMAIGAQFAQEPAHFIGEARRIQREIPVGNRETLARDVPVTFLTPPSRSCRNQNIILLVGYAPDGHPSPSLIWLAQNLTRLQLDVHICLVVNEENVVVEASELGNVASLATRPNDSYDFGAWSAMIVSLADIWEAKRIFFLNDSVLVANPRAFDEIINDITASSEDYVALTESFSPVHHAQSYFFQISGKALSEWRIRSFWASLPANLTKNEIINRCELTFMSLVEANKLLTSKVMFSLSNLFQGAVKFGNLPGNTSHLFWERLLLKGMPFVKSELLHKNPMGLPIKHWREAVEELGGDVALFQRHLDEMDRVRPATYTDYRRTPLNLVLLYLLGRSSFANLRLWNRRRRMSRKMSETR